MSASSFGHLFRIQTFGESHGAALGVVIDGCPAGLEFDEKLLKMEMDRRRPGASTLAANQIVSPRGEKDEVEVLSGVFEGKTLGTPIAMIVRNQDAQSSDYEALKIQVRPGHADDVWSEKFGHRDHRGGGRSSGRETVSRVMGGAVAKMLIRKLEPSLQVRGFASAVGPFILTSEERQDFLSQMESSDDFSGRFPTHRHFELKTALAQLQSEGESWGGVAEIVLDGVPKSLGQPVFHKLKSDLSLALMSVGATSALEIGDGLHKPEQKGSEFHGGLPSAANASFANDFVANPYGGIRGGLSTGERISIKVHFKPTSSILDVAKKGRHDPCILIRAIPVLEAMTYLVLADHLLWKKLDRLVTHPEEAL